MLQHVAPGRNERISRAVMGMGVGGDDVIVVTPAAKSNLTDGKRGSHYEAGMTASLCEDHVRDTPGIRFQIQYKNSDNTIQYCPANCNCLPECMVHQASVCKMMKDERKQIGKTAAPRREPLPWMMIAFTLFSERSPASSRKSAVRTADGRCTCPRAGRRRHR